MLVKSLIKGEREELISAGKHNEVSLRASVCLSVSASSLLQGLCHWQDNSKTRPMWATCVGLPYNEMRLWSIENTQPGPRLLKEKDASQIPLGLWPHLPTPHYYGSNSLCEFTVFDLRHHIGVNEPLFQYRAKPRLDLGYTLSLKIY